MDNLYKKIDIICFSDIWWDHIWQRHQNIMTRFPKNWKILFIEPTSLPILIKEPKRIFLRKRDNIIIASLPTLPLIDRIENFRWINDNLILLWLKIIMRSKSIKEPILFYHEPRFSSLIERLNKKFVIYDCIDDKLGFSNVPKWMKIYLDILVDKANIIFVVSSVLYNKMTKNRKDCVYLIGNGVDVELFKKAMTNISIPDDMKMVKKPIVGYIGAIDEWFDFDIIKEISDRYPNLSIVLLGPVFPKAIKDVNALKKYHNIFLIDKRPHEILPNYLRTFDICIIPFKINERIESSSPGKLYNYLTSGKNVISTSIPEVNKYQDIIYVAKNKEEFVNYIETVLHKIPDTDKFLEIAEENSWNKKVEEMTKFIIRYIDQSS